MRKTKVSTSFFIKNRKNLLNSLPDGTSVVLTSNYQMPRNGDRYFPYRQSSNFFYMTGVMQEKTKCILHKRSDNDFTETLFILPSSKELETWEGHKLTPDEAAEISGIKDVKSMNDFDAALVEVSQNTESFYLEYHDNPRFMPETGIAVNDLVHNLKQQFPLHKFERVTPLFTRLRTIKAPDEIALMRKAIQITDDAFAAVRKVLKPGMYEYEIEAELTYQFMKAGARDHAFDPIVASGKNACVLHYVTNDDVCNNGEMLLLDFGAEYMNYSADCSRTIPVNGGFNARQEEVYKACLDAFLFARELFKPGVSINDINNEVERFLGNTFVELGLFKQKALIDNSMLVKKYYPHGTSHFLGLDTHDAGGKDVVFEPGMVLTCEPGIYINHEGIGVRLENDILITEDGYEDLMRNIPFEF